MEVTFNPQNPSAPTNSGEPNPVTVYPKGNALLNSLSDVACPTTTQCTAVGYGGVEATFNPLGATLPITITNPGYSFGTTPVSINGGSAVACPILAECVTVGSGSEVTFNPQNPGSPASIKGGLAVVACATATQCTAVGGASAVTFNPASPGYLTPVAIDSGQNLDGVACPTVGECVAIDEAGYETTGTTTTPGSSATASQIKAALSRMLTGITGKNARIRALLKNGGYKFRFSFPGAGKLVIDWYAKSKGRRTLIASAAASYTKGTVKLKLDKTGRKLLKNAQKLKVTEKASFTPTSGRTTTLTKAITLTR
jgi:hypothetical protein